MPVHESYNKYKAQVDQLARLAGDVADVFATLQLGSHVAQLETLKERLHSQSFKMLVVGDFKTGKSTVINAMLRAEILPSYAVPTTAIINEVKWGPVPRAFVYTKDGEKREIPVLELPQYVVINDSAPPESKYSKVELFWPLEICRDGVEIIDTPGLNEHEAREQITSDYLARADAVIFVLDSQKLGSVSELRFVDCQIRASGHDDVFFLCNKINLIRRADDVQRVRDAGFQKLAPRTKYGHRRIYYVNALGALESQTENDSELTSDFVKFEQDLADFLTQDKGRVKLWKSAFELKRAIRAAERAIPERISLLKVSEEEFERRCLALEEPLHRMESERDVIVEQLDRRFQDVGRLVAEAATIRLNEIADQLPDIAKKYTLIKRISISLTQTAAERAILEVTNEVVDVLNDAVTEEYSKWQSDELQSMVAAQIEPIASEFDSNVRRLVKQLDDMHLDLLEGRRIETTAPLDGGPSTVNRLFSFSLGLLLGADIGQAGLGAALGFKELVKNAIPQAAIWIAGLSLFGPFAVIPALGYAFYKVYAKVNELNDAIKTKTADQFVNELRREAPARGKATADSVILELRKIRDLCRQSMQSEIDMLIDQVRVARADREKGRASIEQRLSDLAHYDRRAKAVDLALDDALASASLG